MTRKRHCSICHGTTRGLNLREFQYDVKRHKECTGVRATKEGTVEGTTSNTGNAAVGQGPMHEADSKSAPATVPASFMIEILGRMRERFPYASEDFVRGQKFGVDMLESALRGYGVIR